MNLDEAITNLSNKVKDISPDAVLRIKRRSSEEGSIRVYAASEHEAAIKAATQEITLNLLTEHGLDLQLLVYDIATSLPPEEQG
jgi:hypothetical protein